MRVRPFAFLALLFLLRAVTVPFAVAGPPTLAEHIVAIVNGKILFLSDLRREAALFPDPDGSSSQTDRLDRLIDLHLLLEEARRFVPEGPTPQAVEAKAREVRARMSPHFRETLLGLGIDDDGFMALVRERAWIERLIEERVRAFTFVSPKAVEAYRQALGEKAMPAEEEIRRILADRMAAERERDLLLRLRKQATLQVNGLTEGRP